MMQAAVQASRHALSASCRSNAVSASHLLASAAGAVSRFPVHHTIKRNYVFKKVDRWTWAAQRLMENGEEIIDSPRPPTVEVTEQLLNSPPEKIYKLAEQFFDLDLLEMNQLTHVVQKRLGITDEQLEAMMGSGGAGGGAGGAGANAEAEAPKEKDVFTLKISAAVDAKAKIKVIKEVRAITGLGLKEAKELVEKAPCVLKEGLKKDEAENFKKLLTESGAVVELV